MPTLIVKVKELRYNKKTYLRGDTFEASEKDANVLKTIGKAGDPDQKSPLRSAAPAPAQAARPRNTLTLESESADRPRGRGRYARRDLRSED